MEDLEDMMFMEAVRLSLAAEEDRKRKAEKEERKDAKKREKEERKAAKAAAKYGHGPYGGGSEGRSGQSSASGSSLSLGFGRKRGNSATGNLRTEASVANAMASTSGGGESPTSNANPKDKGKAVDRGLQGTPEDEEITPESTAASSNNTARTTTSSRPIPSLHQPAGPSHLRQMSNASSVSSSLPDSQANSYTPTSHLHDPRASGLSLGSRSGASEDGGDHDRDRDPSASTEPMFNFRSLAEVVGVTLEGEHAGRRISRIEAEKRESGTGAATESDGLDAPDTDAGRVAHIDDDNNAGHNSRSQTLQGSSRNEGHNDEQDPSVEANPLAPPTVMVTPGTPRPSCCEDEESKQLGHESTVERLHQIAQ